MTVPTETRPLAPASVAAALTTLRSRGLRVSAARRLVLEALFAAEAPVSAEAIAAGLGGRLPGSDLASVYRNLDTLEAIGLVRHVHFGHGAGLYALSRRHVHGYAACEGCGAHHALPAAVVEAVADVVREACGYETRLGHFPIAGRCPDCEEHHAHP
ncbi:MAG: Fur family transcriptional regulator [Solirubrobacteraceae bacterium]